MSTDETLPTRRPKPASPDPASQAPTEMRPAFEPAQPPAAQPSFQPARPRFAPGSPAQPAEPGYQRSAEPQTVRSEALRPAQAQAGQPPRSSFDPGSAGQPASPAPQYGRSPYDSAPPSDATARFDSAAPSDATARFDSAAPYAETARFGAAGQYGVPTADPQGYGSAQYGRETGYDDQQAVPPAGKRRRPGRRRRRIIMSVFAVIVVLIVLVIGDFVAKQVAQYEIASQITSADSAIHPSVTIQGFPFLTQVISRDLKEIDISASNVQAGPVTISTVSAKAKGIHVNGAFNGGEVDSISGTASITFASLQNALSSQSQGIANISLSAAGPSSVKASFGVLGANVLTQTGTVAFKGSQVSVTWSQSGGDNGGGILGSVLGNSGTLPNLSFTLPKLPAGLQVTGLSVTSTGISLTVAAQHTTLSQ
jgi:hypothetical protein